MKITGWCIAGLLLVSFLWPRPDWPAAAESWATLPCDASAGAGRGVGLGCCPQAPQHTTAPERALLPGDPFQRAATKALRGDYGPLKDWQANAYAWGLAQGVTCTETACVTTYYPQEGFWRGKPMRSGKGVNDRYAAVYSSDWRELRGCYVWVMPAENLDGVVFGGMRQVMDTGANSNASIAAEWFADRWLDYWMPTPIELIGRTPYCFIKTY